MAVNFPRVQQSDNLQRRNEAARQIAEWFKSKVDLPEWLAVNGFVRVVRGIGKETEYDGEHLVFWLDDARPLPGNRFHTFSVIVDYKALCLMLAPQACLLRLLTDASEALERHEGTRTLGLYEPCYA